MRGGAKARNKPSERQGSRRPRPPPPPPPPPAPPPQALTGTAAQVRLEGRLEESYEIDKEPWVVIGGDPGAAGVAVAGPEVAPVHVALVHHNDGRLWLIDLKSPKGTELDGRVVPGHKPQQIRDGARFTLGGNGSREFVVRVESSAPKRSSRDGDDAGAPPKRPAGGRPSIVTASHVLLKSVESRNPKVRHKGNIPVTRSKAEAREQLQRIRDDIVAKVHSFGDMAQEHSECSSAKRGGDLGPFEFGQMMRPFSEAAYSLEVGEMSDLVWSDSGVHIILRTA